MATISKRRIKQIVKNVIAEKWLDVNMGSNTPEEYKAALGYLGELLKTIQEDIVYTDELREKKAPIQAVLQGDQQFREMYLDYYNKFMVAHDVLLDLTDYLKTKANK